MTGRLAHAHFRAGTSGDALGPLGGLADTGAAPMPGTASPGALDQWEGRLLLLYAQVAVRAVGILASALTWHGDWDQARDYLDGCLRSARSLQIVHSERSALAYLAELDTLHGRPRDALTRLHPVTSGHSPPATERLRQAIADSPGSG